MSNTRVTKGVEYACVEGFRPLLADVYLPGTAGASAPAVIHVHGGGWRVGRRSALGPVMDKMEPCPFQRLAAAGYAVVSVDYRLSGEAVFPAQLHDVKAAVRWVRRNAADLQINPERIFVWGESAGGHLACLTGLTADREALEGDVGVTDVSSRVAGVIDWYGPTDLARLPEQRLPGSPPGLDGKGSREAGLLGADPQERPDVAAAASPMTYVHEGAPPFFIAHGTEDVFVPPAQSSVLVSALTNAGAAAELLLIDGAGHMWSTPEKTERAVRTAFEATLQFLDRLAAPQPVPTP
jgi:acetyl esterase/lipase